MLSRIVLTSLFALALPAFGSAQAPCSNLAVHVQAPPHAAVQIALTHAAPHAPAYLALAEHRGQTVFDFGGAGHLVLGLQRPLLLVPIGTTDGSGALHLRLPVPPSLHLVVQAQAFTVVSHLVHHQPRLEFCTSNVTEIALRPGG